MLNSKTRKRLLRISLGVLAIVLLAALMQYLVFPQETRAMLIRYSQFQHKENIYYRASAAQGGSIAAQGSAAPQADTTAPQANTTAAQAHTTTTQLDTLTKLIKQAENRIDSFWGAHLAKPLFIYCADQSDFEHYSAAPDAPAITYCKLGERIVLSQDGIDLDIISHEISHAELYARIGFYRWAFKIPDWFKHGLAMQNDYRDYYSLDTLKAWTDGLRILPDITQFKTSDQFYNGSTRDVMIRYMAAKHKVKLWYTKPRLLQLMSQLNANVSFDEAFARH